MTSELQIANYYYSIGTEHMGSYANGVGRI